MRFHKHTLTYCCLFVLTLLVAACDKVDITFGSSASATDPNITYFDNYATTIATFKPDSFVTSAHHVLTMGYHDDSVFGVVKAGSFAQIDLPATNPLVGITDAIVFDSLQLLISPSGSFYGDSAKAMKINVYRLTQNIKTDNSVENYYNTTSFSYAPSPIGQQTVSLYAKSGTPVSVRLSDALGQELLQKFKNSDVDVSTQENFINYFTGIYLTTDSTVTNSLAYFRGGNASATDTLIMRLNYHQNGTTPVAKTIDFAFDVTKQFNHISFRHLNANFAAFINNKAQLIPSAASGNQSFLNNNLGASIKISFPTLLNLKELHPYVKVVKATLVIKPDQKSSAYPYLLPSSLYLYSTDESNLLISGIYSAGTSATLTLQTGNLVVDNLYNENTYYSYDITSFINTKIGEGQGSTSSLKLTSSAQYLDAGLQRLIVNDQNNNRPIQLQLYVLGL